MVEIRTYEKPTPRDVRHEHPIVAWELHQDEDTREWALSPWTLLVDRATRWEWPDSAEDIDVELRVTPTAKPTVTARYRIDDEGNWVKIEEDDEPRETAKTG